MTIAAPWPPLMPYAESLQLIGEDQTRTFFPNSPGDREKGKFRPGSRPDTDVVAVSNDDGTPIGFASQNLILDALQELIREVRAMRLGLVHAENNVCEDIDPQSLSDDNDAWL